MKYALLLSLVFFTSGAHAQPNPGDPDAPITGIEYLLGLGALLGIKRMMNSQKKKLKE